MPIDARVAVDEESRNVRLNAPLPIFPDRDVGFARLSIL